VAQPLYLRIAEDLEERIKSGSLPQGGQLPTEADLRETYDASRNTIRDAIKRLAGKGLIETRAGKGTYVIQKRDPFVTLLTADPLVGVGVGEGATYLSDVSAKHRQASVTTPKVEVQTAVGEVTKRLRVPRGTPLVSRHQQRYIDGHPWSLQTSFYPMEFVTRGAHLLLSTEDITQGAVKYLGEAIGLSQIGYRDWITVRSLDSNEQEFFRIADNATVFEIFRTGFDQHQKPMRVTVTVFPTDRNQFIVNVGDLPDPQYDEDPNDNDDEDPQVTA
jgi:GntR family transcriptional regulator